MSGDRGGQIGDRVDLLQLTRPSDRQQPFHRAFSVVAARALSDAERRRRDEGQAGF